MVDNLFVYGTLAPGRQNEHVLKDIAGKWQKASIRGRLYEEGWGADLGCPGLRLDDKGSQIQGFLFTSSQIQAHWNNLDRFEGKGYKRILTTVTLKNQNTVAAFVYVLK